MGWFTDSKFAFCRGVANHAWTFPPTMEWHGRKLFVTLHCANCGTKRRDAVSAFNGEVESRAYDYADGYLLELHGKHRPPKHTLRRDGLQLLLESVKATTAPKAAVRSIRRARKAVA